MPLAWLSQDDFAAGAVRSVARHLMPPNAAYTILNGLLDSDGSVYRRGGSEYVTSAALTVANKLTWLWSGHLVAGPRTLLHTGSSLGVIAADGTSVILLGFPVADPLRGHSAVVNGLLFMSGGAVYGGSRKTTAYSTGTIAVTQGSKIMTGTGTAWAANVDAGMLMASGPDAAARYYVVESVDSDTQITLADPWEYLDEPAGTYTLKPLGSTVGMLYRTALSYATVAERLVTVEGSRLPFSNARNELGILKPHVFTETDYHELPEGAVGLGAAAIRDLLLVFATDGIWTINNMAFDLTDAAGNVQQQMQRSADNVVLWGTGAIATYHGSLVVAATDGVYLVDGVSTPVSVSESIAPLLASYVKAGHRPGRATVFNGHYFLPVITAEALTHAVVDLLVCRLDRPAKIRGRVFFPWTQFSGHGGNVGALTTRVAANGTNPELLGAGASDGRVLNLGTVFTPDATNATDANATAHTFLLETRDYPTGRGNVNTVRQARVRYELIDAATDNPTLSASYSPGTDTWTALTPNGAEDTGANKHTWLLAAGARYFRLRLQSTDPAARLTLRSVEIAVRPSGQDR